MKQTTGDHLRAAWRALRIEPSQIVICHSSLTVFGRLVDGPTGVVQTLLDVLGPSGTLIVPTFTYSYFNREVYDPATTPSTVGVFGEVVRKVRGAIRSLDPNFSHVGIGAHAADLLSWNGEPSWGKRSFYDRLIALDGRVLLLGVGFEALPIFMHLERVLQVPYRYDKVFEGETLIEGKRVQTNAIHAVRDERFEPRTDRSIIGAIIDQNPECRRTQLAYGIARYVATTVVEATVRGELARNQYVLLDAQRPFEKAYP